MGTNLGYFDNWLYGIIGDHMIEMHKARVVATASAMGGVEAKDAAAEALYVKSLPDMMTAVKRDEVIAEWRRARKAQNAALAAAAADDMILAGPPLAVGASTATLSTGTVPSPLHLPSGPTTAHVQSERRLLVDARVPAPVNAHVRVGPPAAAAPPSPDAMLMAGLSDSAIARFIVATADARDGAAPATAAIPVISSATTPWLDLNHVLFFRDDRRCGWVCCCRGGREERNRDKAGRPCKRQSRRVARPNVDVSMVRRRGARQGRGRRHCESAPPLGPVSATCLSLPISRLQKGTSMPSSLSFAPCYVGFYMGRCVCNGTSICHSHQRSGKLHESID